MSINSEADGGIVDNEGGEGSKGIRGGRRRWRTEGETTRQ